MFRSILAGVFVAALAACSEQTQQQKVESQLAQVYPLKADERQAATNNAKKYFEKEWIIANNARGQLNECRPSDSNANGMVSCFGFVPKPGGGFNEVKMFCGYRPELVGCSNEDTVK